MRENYEEGERRETGNARRAVLRGRGKSPAWAPVNMRLQICSITRVHLLAMVTWLTLSMKRTRVCKGAGAGFKYRRSNM